MPLGSPRSPAPDLALMAANWIDRDLAATSVAATMNRMEDRNGSPSEIRDATTRAASPRPFEQWRADPLDRDEDAAYAFGHALIAHCRDEAVKAIPSTASEAERASALDAVDKALHNVCDLLEGFWCLEIDPRHRIELALQVRVLNIAGEVVETREISPSKVDLPIGYWKWARDREFR